MELAIEPAEAQVVRQIYEWFAGGLSLRAIAHRLNAEAVPFPAQSTGRGPHAQGAGPQARSDPQDSDNQSASKPAPNTRKSRYT